MSDDETAKTGDESADAPRPRDQPAGDELVPPELFDEDVYDHFYGAVLETAAIPKPS